MNRRRNRSVIIGLAISAIFISTAQVAADYKTSLNFETVSSIPLSDAAAGMAVSGSLVYVPAGKAGLYVIDVSDPAKARVAAVVDTPGVARAVAISRSYAYLADETGGLQIIDITNPTAPSIVGALDGEAAYVRVAVASSYAYAADTAGALHIIDISSPQQPKEISRHTIGDKKSIRGLTVRFPYVFIAHSNPGSWWGPDVAKAELSIIDVSDPQSPQRLGSLRTRHVGQDIAVSGQYAFLACADLGGSSGLEVIDISEPSVPTSVGYVNFPELSRAVVRLKLRGDFAFVAAGKVMVVNVSNPSLPYLADVMYPRASAVDISFSGELAYVALEEWRCQKCPSAGSFQVWKPSTKTVLPVSRFLSGSEPAPHTPDTVQYPNTSSAVAISKSLLCAVMGSTNESKLQVIDLSDPKNPQASGYCSLKGEAKDLGIWENFALVAADGLAFVDLSDSSRPVVVHTVEEIKGAYALEISGSYAYVVDGAGLRIVDIKSPVGANIVGSIETPDSARDVAVSKNIAYIANGAGLQIVDISDKDAPKLMGSLYYEWAMATRVAAEGNIVCLGDRAGFVTLIDVRDPSAPVILGKKQLAGSPGAMAISGGKLFVSVCSNNVIVQSLDIAEPVNSPFLSARGLIHKLTRQRDLNRNPQPAGGVESWGKERSVYRGGAVAISGSKIYVIDLDQGLLVGTLSEAAPGPTIMKVEPEELAASYELGMDAAPLRLAVSNAGTGAIKYAVSSDAEWLKLSPCVGDLQENERSMIELSLSPSMLREGTHAAKILVADPSSRNPHVIPLTLEVLPSRYPPINFQPTWLNLKDVKPGRVEKVILSSEGAFKVLQASASYPWVQVEIDSEKESLEHALTVTINGRCEQDKCRGSITISTNNPLYKRSTYSFSISFTE